jgi:transcriptional regulator with XRE-family HTH domain
MMKTSRIKKQVGPTESPEGVSADLGAKIRSLRLECGWTLGDLARSIGLSMSGISQIENGRIEPSLQTLRKLATAFRIPLARLFETPSSVDNRVVRRDARRVFHLPRSRLRYELLSPDLVNKRVEFLRMEMDPDSGEKPTPYAHPGEEYGIVLQGKAEIFVDGTTYILFEGDSIFFDATSPHYVRNVGSKVAAMVWAIAPPNPHGG